MSSENWIGSNAAHIDPLVSQLRPSPRSLYDIVRTERKHRGVGNLLRFLKMVLLTKYKNPFNNTFSYSEIDYLFIRTYLKIGHPYGITLSVDQIGCGCQISQNANIGTNIKFQAFDQGTAGFRPRLGFCVRVNPGALITGPVTIGSFSIISGNSVVTKDVPPLSIVYGINEIEPIKDHHFLTFLHILHQQHIVAGIGSTGILWRNGTIFFSDKYKAVENLFIKQYGQASLKNNIVAMIKEACSVA